jgi:hypothetical protein
MYPTHQDRIAPPEPSAPILGKFKDQAALEAAYTEAEKKITEYGTKVKDYEDYASIGKPSEIKEALDWARNVKTAMERGLLTPKEAQQAVNQGPPSQTRAPWEDDNWAYKQPNEQAQALAAHTEAQVKKYVDQIAAQYGQQLSGFRQTDGREKALLLKVVEAVAKNPSLNANEMLTQAAQLAQRSPEELIDMVMDAQMNSPEMREKAVEAKVATRLAEEQQKWEKSKFNDVLHTQKPKFGRTPANREAENRQILESLAKQGIRIL